jgi:hypothetical protein
MRNDECGMKEKDETYLEARNEEYGVRNGEW